VRVISPPDQILRVLLDNHARFLAFVERRVGSREEAEDILQEAFVRSLDRASSIRNSDSATAWFYRVLRNALTDYFRRQDRRGRAVSRLVQESDASSDPDAELEAVVCACVLDLVETLKPEYGRGNPPRGSRGRECAQLRRRDGHYARQRRCPAAPRTRGAAKAGGPNLQHLHRARLSGLRLPDRHYIGALVAQAAASSVSQIRIVRVSGINQRLRRNAIAGIAIG
jgi:RNA polymerase sigma factor (sigma-70 family)